MNSDQLTFDFMQPGFDAGHGTVNPFVRPWMDMTRPFQWRRYQLQLEAERVGAACIIYRKGTYGQSLCLARKTTDTFYQQHQSELWPNKGLTGDFA